MTSNSNYISVPSPFKPLFQVITDPRTSVRYIVMYGGRGSGKTFSACMAIIWLAAHYKVRILCCREFQNSIKQSSFSTMIEAINLLGLNDRFIVTANTITGINGSEFIFMGLANNINSVRSLNKIDVVFVDEAHSISRNSLDVLDPTIRGGHHFPNSIFIYCLNPQLETDPVYWDHIVGPCPHDTIRIEANYWHNPHLAPKVRDNADRMRTEDPLRWAHIYGGSTTLITDDAVLVNWTIEDLDDDIPPDAEPMIGIDWGFRVSPTVAVEMYYFNSRLYVHRDAYDYHVSNQHLPGLIAGNSHTTDRKQWINQKGWNGLPCLANGNRAPLIIADNARPELVDSFLEEYGFNIMPCDKATTSVIDGFGQLNSMNVAIHPSCVNTIRDFRGLKLKRDPQTDLPIWNKIIDLFKDAPDAVRYGSEILRKNLFGGTLHGGYEFDL